MMGCGARRSQSRVSTRSASEHPLRPCRIRELYYGSDLQHEEYLQSYVSRHRRSFHLQVAPTEGSLTAPHETEVRLWT